jgi:acyl carrier protein
VNEADVEAILITRLAASRGSSREEVLLDLEGAGAIDSLEGVELVIEAEQVFGIAISDRDLSSDVCRSIPELVALIQSKLGQSPEANGKAGR